MVAVVKELGIEISEAQLRYNSIRTMFFKYLRTVCIISSGSGRYDAVLKEDFECLIWLILNIKAMSGTVYPMSAIGRRPVGDHLNILVGDRSVIRRGSFF